MSEWGTGVVTGGKLYCRKQPISGYEAWGRFNNGATIPIKAYDNTWYETYWNGNTSNVGYVMKQYITNENWSGSSSGNTGDASFPAGSFGKTTKTGVRVRTTPGGSNFKQVVQGSMFYIEGTATGPKISGSDSTVWVKVRFGKGDGSHESRYIHSSCFGNVQTLSSSVKPRLVAIAKSLEKNTGSGLGLSGDWCQRFIYWLLGACGIDGLSFPSSGYCGQARLAWVNCYGATWHQRGDGYVPSAGDLIYYGDLNSDISSHVGIVVTGGSSFSTIEGNMGTETNQTAHKVKLCTGSVSEGKCNNRSYQGFLKLNY